jgi:putative alpha-1,2-mannosidase
VAPGSEQYAIGSPAVKEASIKLENGKTFTIRTKGQSDKNVYVQKMELNGKPLNRHYLTHSELASGGELTFYMGAKPNKKQLSMR